MEEAAECMLVLIGATPEGRKELVGLQTGVRESAQSWRDLLTDIKQRGFGIVPDLAIGDGALGFSGRSARISDLIASISERSKPTMRAARHQERLAKNLEVEVGDFLTAQAVHLGAAFALLEDRRRRWRRREPIECTIQRLFVELLRRFSQATRGTTIAFGRGTFDPIGCLHSRDKWRFL